MPAHRIEQQLEQLNKLRSEPAKDAKIVALGKALADRSNVVAAKAATLTGEFGFKELIPDLETAFERFFQKPIETDPQCWAKNAISKALKDLDHAESALFLRGLRHVQMEPVYGGRADTAATLRGTCALGLVQCRDLPRQEIMRRLVGALTESAATVRADAARALEQTSGADAALLLRLKARAGDSEPEVTGQVLDSLLDLEGDQAVGFVAEFLDSADENIREEAALALGASRLPCVVEVLTDAWTRSRDTRPGEPLLRAISASRHESGFEFLLKLVRGGREREARDAVKALALHKDSPEIARRVQEAVEARDQPFDLDTLNRLLR
jgi:HEAT repeat protein